VAACSALKRTYRDTLRATSGADLLFVHLAGSRELISARMSHRTGHFFPETLLDSQFATLGPPQADERHVVADLRMPLEEMIARAIRDIEEFDA
jgi:gluconokinase